MADVADYTQAVNVVGGSVSITGPATVSITGTPTVAISGTPTVNVGNTPSVSIASGTVTANISGTPNVNIQGQAVTLNVNQPQTLLGSLTVAAASGGTGTFSLPAGTHAVGVLVPQTAQVSLVSVVGGQSNVLYPGAALGITNLGAGYFLYPVASVKDTSVSVSISNNTNTQQTFYLVAVLDTQALHVTTSEQDPVLIKDAHTPADWRAPNQTPVAYSISLAAGVAATLVSPIGGNNVWLWTINLLAINTTNFFGVFQTTGVQTAAFWNWSSSQNGSVATPFFGAPMGAGNGIQVRNAGSGTGSVSGTVVYSTGPA